MSYSELTAHGPGGDCRSPAHWQGEAKVSVPPQTFWEILRHTEAGLKSWNVGKTGHPESFTELMLFLFVSQTKNCASQSSGETTVQQPHKRRGFWVENKFQLFLVLCKHTGGRSIICILVDYKRSGNLIMKWWASGTLPLGLGKQSFLAPFSL